MKPILFTGLVLALAVGLAAQTPEAPPPAKSPRPPVATQPATATPIQKNVETYLRKIYAWGPSFRVQVGPLAEAPVSGFYEVSVLVTKGDQSDSAVVYVSKDGRYLFRGEIQDMSVDPLAAVRSQIRLADSPAKGPVNARVVLVEYGDFQCPTCRQLYKVLREIEPNYPQLRVVFKDFPLTQIHPWAMTAALAGRCAYQHNHEAFWKVHDAIFDSQEVISPGNAYQKMLDFAAQAGLDASAFRACLASPQTGQAITQSIKEGQALKIANTPTVFVNGRRLIGADRELLEQYIQYELGAAPTALKK
ncbi:MAG: thioredoxin domain-containing protein [Acidobacteria bacterium]|nr:thioredoxin domain-containing protein [Acidobacteriota bacterium]